MKRAGGNLGSLTAIPSDQRFHVDRDEQVLSDAEVESLIDSYIEAAQVAANAGADFVDIKHCHGYLLHEFLSAHTRPGRYGVL